MPAIASSAPDIMIGQIAALTTRIRVGSGGVMLPNHAPLMVAERFKVLEALYPGRIDLGLGRAPGTDPATSYALRRRQGISEEDDFLERFNELMLLESARLSRRPSVPQRAGDAVRRARCRRSICSARPTTARNWPARSARPLPSRIISRPSTRPRRCGSIATISRPRRRTTKPYAILGTHVVCADSDAEAERLAATVDLNIVRRAKGEYLPLASPEDAAAYDYTPVDRARIAQNRARMSVGSPATVKAKLAPLLEATQADELMVTTMIYDHAARKHSYELLKQAFS